jgi:hypothetical protein
MLIRDEGGRALAPRHLAALEPTLRVRLRRVHPVDHGQIRVHAGGLDDEAGRGAPPGGGPGGCPPEVTTSGAAGGGRCVGPVHIGTRGPSGGGGGGGITSSVGMWKKLLLEL